jgi:ABC-type Fe3+ transport system substrate-binding protein
MQQQQGGRSMVGAYLKIGCGLLAFAVLSFLFLLASHAAFAATQSPRAAGAAPNSSSDLNREWTDLAAAAKREGKLMVNGGASGAGGGLGATLTRFGEKFGLKVTIGRGAGGVQAERMLAERRGGHYSMDIIISGARTFTQTLLPAKALDPVKPLLFHPEVTNASLWKGGVHRYTDREQKYVFAFAARNAPVGISINTKLVKPGEIKSFLDLLQPKWKGKIIAYHPRHGQVTFSNLYHDKNLGPEFLRRIYAEGGMAYVTTVREFADGLASGAYAIGFLEGGAQRDLREMMDQGLPVRILTARDIGGTALASPGGSGLLGVVNRSANPNATRLFVNWFLGKEAQLFFNKARLNGQGGDYESLRADISNDGVDPEWRLSEKFYLPEADPNFVEKEDAAKAFVDQLIEKLKL